MMGECGGRGDFSPEYFPQFYNVDFTSAVAGALGIHELGKSFGSALELRCREPGDGGRGTC